MNHPLFRRFENEFEFIWPSTSQKMRVQWTGQNGDVFFRPHDLDARILWHTLDVFGKKAPANVLKEAINASQLRRVLPLHTGESVFLKSDEGILHSPLLDYGAAFSIPQEWKDSEAFLWLSPEELSAKTPAILDDNPDYHAARRWLHDSPGRSTDIMVERGTRLELENLLIALDRIFPKQEASHFYFSSGFQSTHLQHLEHFSEWFNILNTYFSPRSVHRYRVRGFSGWHRSFDNDPKFEAAEPTQHERLEALLLWRDFLRGKIPDAEIGTLLRP